MTRKTDDKSDKSEKSEKPALPEKATKELLGMPKEEADREERAKKNEKTGPTDR